MGSRYHASGSAAVHDLLTGSSVQPPAFGFDSACAALLGSLRDAGMRPPVAGQQDCRAMFDDSVQVRCRRCKGVFRERARRLENGYSRQCPTCEVLLFFDEDSQERTIRRAMKAARQVRAALREAEA